MSCISQMRKNQTLKQREREINEALKRLERYLQTGSVKIQIGNQGAIAFNGWKDRNDVTDVCAYRMLTLSNSWALKQAVKRAEMISGKKVNERAIAAGVHSHDNGHTWSTH